MAGNEEALTPLEVEFRFWMEWYVEHQPQIFYRMERPFSLGSHLPMFNDCSATYTDLRFLSGTVDPNDLNYSGIGNTNTLASRGQVCNAKNLSIGDATIYYNGHGWAPENTEHVSMIYALNGENPMTMSHGWSGEPAFVTVENDGRPHQFFKFPNTLRNPPKKPVPKLPEAKGTPTAAQLSAAHLVELKNPAQEKIARGHGWTIWYFSEDHSPNPFVPIIGGKPNHITLYANSAYTMMR